MTLPPEHHDTRDLESQRDDLVRRLLNCEADYNHDGAISKRAYLETRQSLEQRLLQVMDDLARLQQRG